MKPRENKDIPNLRDVSFATTDNRYLEGDGEKEFPEVSIQNPEKENNASEPTKE